MAIPSTDTPMLCPPCELEMELSEDQLHEAEVGLDRIRSASSPLSGIPRLQFRAVSLSDEQENFVMERFGMLFSSDPPMYDDDVMDSPTRTLPRGRRDPSNPASALGRVCPPDGQSHRPLEIAFNITGGPVQVIQLPNMKQWFIEEKCVASTPPYPVNDVVCHEVVRHAIALVINLADPNRGIHEEPIRIQSCVSFYEAT
ncbi:hypothetical protein BSL78_13577 [Apostichopus japonicus]|uniref:Uncharacterized protein n=1 Tax=Stichopus japonicus TaxID=307972 RepID=A0A2G8KNG8_STIJA|nr:hypothetical protein BSL78_13577 [Apostichopus japonicus]